MTGHEGPEGEQRNSPILSLTLALDGGWTVNATPRPLYPGKDLIPAIPAHTNDTYDTQIKK
jgi:hypothetical protein